MHTNVSIYKNTQQGGVLRWLFSHLWIFVLPCGCITFSKSFQTSSKEEHSLLESNHLRIICRISFLFPSRLVSLSWKHTIGQTKPLTEVPLQPLTWVPLRHLNKSKEAEHPEEADFNDFARFLCSLPLLFLSEVQSTNNVMFASGVQHVTFLFISGDKTWWWIKVLEGTEGQELIVYILLFTQACSGVSVTGPVTSCF